MGALVGGIYAAGELDAYASWVSNLTRSNVVRLLGWSFSKGAIFDSERVISVLKDMVGECDIEDLEIDFTAVATDNRGPLFEAIQASIAMPLIFPPVERGDLLLVDGGLLNPVPIAPTLNADSKLTIAITLNGPNEKIDLDDTRQSDEEDDDSFDFRERITRFIDSMIPRKSEDASGSLNAIELALQSIDTMQRAIAEVKLAVYAPDLTIQMPANLCTFLEFHRATELIEFGYRRTGEALRKAGLIDGKRDLEPDRQS